ncbi:hypothetical protein GCM10022393_24160 [Aquimarina addita]|uniref:Uncharacterized protein n=2 Tax=Aquimarina addita TaxID=870485 RepID=A0ABP6UKD3_9FLAO
MYVSEIISNCIPFLSDRWKASNSDFLIPEYIDLFAKKMETYLYDGIPETYPLPLCNDEKTPALSEVIRHFIEVIKITRNNGGAITTDVSKLWAIAIENTTFEYLMILMGQRYTASSSKGKAALPPAKVLLLKSAFTSLNEQILVATKAWEKHAGRSANNFWGEVKGGPKEKEKKVKNIVITMIKNHTWWNIFFHYKHGLVYEIRVPSGHGIRWNRKGTRLIGFLEPFL